MIPNDIDYLNLMVNIENLIHNKSVYIRNNYWYIKVKNDNKFYRLNCYPVKTLEIRKSYISDLVNCQEIMIFTYFIGYKFNNDIKLNDLYKNILNIYVKNKIKIL